MEDAAGATAGRCRRRGMSAAGDRHAGLRLLASRLRHRGAGQEPALSRLERELNALRGGAGPLSVVVVPVPAQRRWRRRAARALRDRLRRDQPLFRLAPDELLVVCPDTDPGVAGGLARDLHRVLMTTGIDAGQGVGYATAVAQVHAATLIELARASRLRSGPDADQNEDGPRG
jgi:hypothetical protein